jgi:hypothetical protein
MASTPQRPRTKLPLSPICNPCYKLAQITQQHELDVGCYSPEARTSINPVYAIFVQPSEARHTIREIIYRQFAKQLEANFSRFAKIRWMPSWFTKPLKLLLAYIFTSWQNTRVAK